ncbi:ATP-binding protein [Roseomonas sp. GCM10028921]
MTCDVLVLDDDELVLDVTVQALEDAGYAVQMAENADAALQYLEGPGPCQVVVTDINLGEPLNGFGVVERTRMVRPDIKVIYYSGLPSNWHGQLLGEQERRLNKPFRFLTEAYVPAVEDAGRRMEAAIAPRQTVTGSPPLLRQALANLLDNSLSHGEGTVKVTLRPGALLEVSDQGPGIRPEEREKVMRRFYRLDRSRGTPGTGLGLSLAAAVAKLHGGTLTLGDTASGRGLSAVLEIRQTPPAEV